MSASLRATLKIKEIQFKAAKMLLDAQNQAAQVHLEVGVSDRAESERQ